MEYKIRVKKASSKTPVWNVFIWWFDGTKDALTVHLNQHYKDIYIWEYL